MSTRKIITIACAAGAILAANVIGASSVEARWYNSATQSWQDEKPQIKRRIDQRKVPSKFKKRLVSISTNEAPGTLIIHTDEKFLYQVRANGKAMRYGVGVGREGFGWNGAVNIKRKAEWPTWTPPKEMILRERENGRELPASMEGGIENPLGARAMYLYKGNQDTLYRIHGTNQPWSIGLNLSSGCIRMNNKDIEELYDQVNIGTKVVVIGPGENPASVFTEFKNPLAALFNAQR